MQKRQTKHGVSDAIPTAGMIDPAVARQKAACEQLIGSWDDDRSAEEIVADITNNRTMGREVVSHGARSFFLTKTKRTLDAEKQVRYNMQHSNGE